MVSFSIKPGDQTDETESPNLVNKTVGTQSQRYQSFPFFLYMYKVFWEIANGGVTNWSKTSRNKVTASWIL